MGACGRVPRQAVFSVYRFYSGTLSFLCRIRWHYLCPIVCAPLCTQSCHMAYSSQHLAPTSISSSVASMMGGDVHTLTHLSMHKASASFASSTATWSACTVPLQCCLQKEPDQRPSAEALLGHQWIKIELLADAKGIPEVCTTVHH